MQHLNLPQNTTSLYSRWTIQMTGKSSRLLNARNLYSSGERFSVELGASLMLPKLQIATHIARDPSATELNKNISAHR